MNNRLFRQSKRLAIVLKLYPQIKVVNYLGSGNKGEAYLLEDGKVLKGSILKVGGKLFNFRQIFVLIYI